MGSILDQIGGTPVVELSRLGSGLDVPVFAKCEHLNPGGSVKDRIALAMIERAERDGLIRHGATIVEATAGNTGVGLALVCAQRGYNLVCVMPEKMSEDKRQALRALGADVVVTDNAPPGDPRNFQQVARRLSEARPNTFWTNQFGNVANPEIHEMTTGPELWRQTGGKIGAFVAGVGTGGSLTGVGRYLKGMNPDIKIVLADPLGSRLAGLINDGELGEDGAYKVEGIGSSQVPDVFDPSLVDFAVTITDVESFAMSERLIREEGLLVGPSSGTSVAAALRVSALGQVAGPIVALLPDSWDRYWSKTQDPAWMAELT